MRLRLLALSLLGLALAFLVLPHRGPDPSASRWQTLSMDYRAASYEDPGLYWLIDVTGASWAQVEFGLMAVALILLSAKMSALSVAIPAHIAFMAAWMSGIFYWSWDVYWAPALSVLVTMVFLLTVAKENE